MKNVAIKENHLYQKAYLKGRRFVTPTVAVYVLRDLAARRLAHAHPQKKIVNRLGLSVSKKIGSAVVRNRAKRVIRAAYDPIRDELRTGFLVVISAREAIRGKKATDVQKDLQKAFSKLDMLKVPQNGGNTQTP
ncbi:MAG: ribonuclease P protein component [Clostridia bacterium]|nr:ribonuclease P protein component [Clostridia bacterium]